MITEDFEFISHRADENTVKSLVFLLHGYGVNAQFMSKMAANILAELPNSLVLSVQAPEIMSVPAQEQRNELIVPLPDEADNVPLGMSKQDQRSWFKVGKDPKQMHDVIYEVGQKLNIFIDKKRDEYGLSDGDIAVMGFSQGGAVAFYSACTRERPIGCVVGHSTIVIDTEGFKTKLPAMLVYGGSDQTFSVPEYQQRSVMPLKQFLPDIDVKEIANLSHTTTPESRAIVADYIRSNLA